MGLLEQAQSNHAEAERLFLRAQSIYEKALGKDHPDVIRFLRNYVALLRESGQEDEATKLEARLDESGGDK